MKRNLKCLSHLRWRGYSFSQKGKCPESLETLTSEFLVIGKDSRHHCQWFSTLAAHWNQLRNQTMPRLHSDESDLVNLGCSLCIIFFTAPQATLMYSSSWKPLTWPKLLILQGKNLSWVRLGDLLKVTTSDRKRRNMNLEQWNLDLNLNYD